MKPSIMLMAVMWLAAAADGHASKPDQLDLSSRYAEGQLLVKFNEGPSSYDAYLAHAALGAEVRRTFGAIGWQHVALPEGMSVADGLAYYQALETVAAVEPNYVRRLTAPPRWESRTDSSRATFTVPNDPQFTNQWNLMKIGATNAWDLSTGSTDVVVAVIDSGVDYDHEDLAANMWRNPGETGLDANGQEKATNGIDDDADGYVDDVYGIDAHNEDSDPKDDLGHGTCCAGLLGAVGNNGRGIAGVNWSVQILSLKFCGADGLGYDSDVIECFEYVIAMKQRGVNVRVTSNSYSGDESSQSTQDALDAAGKEGILQIFSAGNSGSNNDLSPVYPPGFDSPSILAVAASDPEDNLAILSNYGPTSVDLAAPGFGSLTTGLSNTYNAKFWGTSAACPLVAGAVGLLAAYDPGQSAATIKGALLGTVDLAPGLSNKVVSGGRLNLARALQNLVAPNAPSVVTSVLPVGNRTPVSASVQITFGKPMRRDSVESALSLTPAVSGTFAWSNNDRTVTFLPAVPLLPATSYTGRVLGNAQDAAGVTLDGNFTRTSQGSPVDDFIWDFRVPPINDDLAQAAPITGDSGTTTGTNQNATKEPAEPDHAGNAGGASVWYRWTAPADGTITFDTVGTPFDTLLAAYSGGSMESLTQLASNDDDGSAGTSRVTFGTHGGTAYLIAVDGKIFPDIHKDAPPMGNIVLSWYPTPAPAFRDGSAFTPGEGVWGSEVTLNGTNFTGVTQVLFDAVSAKFRNHSDLKITATVPVGALSGPITVQTPHGSVTSAGNFAVQAKVLYTVSRTEPALWVDWASNGFALEYTESLAPPAWKPAPQTPITVEDGQRTVVVLPLDGPSKFYRWRKD